MNSFRFWIICSMCRSRILQKHKILNTDPIINVCKNQLVAPVYVTLHDNTLSTKKSK